MSSPNSFGAAGLADNDHEQDVSEITLSPWTITSDLEWLCLDIWYLVFNRIWILGTGTLPFWHGACFANWCSIFPQESVNLKKYLIPRFRESNSCAWFYGKMTITHLSWSSLQTTLLWYPEMEAANHIIEWWKKPTRSCRCVHVPVMLSGCT